jgi:hypothetical protein
VLRLAGVGGDFIYVIPITNAVTDTTGRVPPRLETSLNYKMLGLIIGLVVSFHISILFGLALPIGDRYDTIQLIQNVTPLIPSILAFIVTRRYWGSAVFGKAYFALGLAFLMTFIGEIVWSYYTVVLQEDPYPSIADIFFFAFYPLAIYHLLKNILYFKRRLDILTKIWLTLIPIAIVSIYAYLASEGDVLSTFDLYYGSIFVAATSTTLSLAVLGMLIFRHTLLGIVWLLLALGIMVNSVADVWYYYLELFDQYDEIHVVNSMWIMGYVLVAYALYKHTKIV